MALRLVEPASTTHRTQVRLEETVCEAIALTDEVTAHVDRLLLAAAAGSRQAVVNEAGRLGYRAAGYRERFRRMAGEIEPGDAA